MAHRGNSDLLDSLTSSLSKDFFKDILSGLTESHQASWKHMEQAFSQPTARDLIPHYRRALFEDKMSEIGRKHGLSVKSVKNITKNASHVEIEANINSKRVIITALMVPNIYDLTRLRTAQFRKTLAEEAFLFKEYEKSGDAYYGVILYGSNPDNLEALDFACLAFPYADCKGLFGRYDLFLLAGKSGELETVEDRADPRLRPDIIRKVE